MKIITYNIDGLPESLDLNDLPWIFKPIAWIYKLIKGTTTVKINDNANKLADTLKIGGLLRNSKADIIALQEDFNYHYELTYTLPEYTTGTYTGGFDLHKLFSNVDWISRFPLPRFKVDGLNILSNPKTTKISEEKIIKWDKSAGYFAHANDALTHKGFRYYKTTINGVEIDVYIVHMDADFYKQNPDISKDIKARKSQLKQLVDFILNNTKNNPAIILGDTNLDPIYSWDEETLQQYLLDPINASESLKIEEIKPKNRVDVDRIFIINNTKASHCLEGVDCYFDEDFKGLSDHYPLVAEIKIF